MNWTELLKSELDDVLRATRGLMELSRDMPLDWKPAAENNWMTLGALLRHLGSSAGAPSKCFATGDWGMPEDFDPADMKMPTAEEMESVESVDDALERLAADEKLFYEVLAEAGEERLANDMVAAPWDPTGTKRLLGQQILDMVHHQTLHKTQLFYYLKLYGKPVNTVTLFGMGA